MGTEEVCFSFCEEKVRFEKKKKKKLKFMFLKTRCYLSCLPETSFQNCLESGSTFLFLSATCKFVHLKDIHLGRFRVEKSLSKTKNNYTTKNTYILICTLYVNIYKYLTK